MVDLTLTRARRCCSFVTVAFSVLLIIAALFGTIFYRAVLRRAYANHELVQKISENIEYVRLGIFVDGSSDQFLNQSWLLSPCI